MNKSSLCYALIAYIAAVWGLLGAVAAAAEYEIDPAHSFVEFRIQHLGYSWLYGRFNDISGDFSYDSEQPEASEIALEIDTASVDTNHAERDKHLRGEDFLDVKQYPKATFKSTGYDPQAGVLKGALTLHGVEKPIEIKVEKMGEGPDPWGGYRAGFIGTTTLSRRDFGIDYDLGPASETLELELGIEGIKQ